jgi:protein TonB
MSYANTTVSPAARLRAATGVIAIHVLAGAGIVLGLTITGMIKPPGTIVETWDVRDIPPPPPQTIPEPVEQTYAPTTAPDPLVRIERDVPITVEPVTPDFSDTVSLLPPPRTLDVPVPVATPSVTPSLAPVGAIPRNGPTGWITTDDYARSDLIRNREGTANYRLVVGSDGRVDACEITRSSGHATLDRNTCRLIERRARFDPATNNRGDTVVGTYAGSVTWQIPD